MSAKKGTGGYSPAPASLTIDEIQTLGKFFKELIDSPAIKWSIIAAGVGAVVDILHVAWLAARFIFKF